MALSLRFSEEALLLVSSSPQGHGVSKGIERPPRQTMKRASPLAAAPFTNTLLGFMSHAQIHWLAALSVLGGGVFSCWDSVEWLCQMDCASRCMLSFVLLFVQVGILQCWCMLSARIWSDSCEKLLPGTTQVFLKVLPRLCSRSSPSNPCLDSIQLREGCATPLRLGV